MGNQLDLGIAEQRTRSLTKRADRISQKASRARHKKPHRLSLPMYMGDFPAKEGVPKTRGDCPKGFCTFIRCRYHLGMEDAEHRAGRPGLASVPRDGQGLTTSLEGDAGEERPGTTIRPDWLELDRTCRALLTWDDAGNVCEVEPLVPVNAQLQPVYTFKRQRIGTWDLVEAKLHPGERLEVYDNDEVHVASAFYMPDGTLCFDRSPFAVSVTLVRARGVASCALNEIERLGKMTNAQVGDAIRRHRTLVGRIIPDALEQAKRAAKRLFGMDAEELLMGLRELGAGG